MRKFGWILLSWCSWSVAANADFLPPNNLHLEDNRESITSITNQDFNDVIDQVSAIFIPVFASYGATLTVDRRWTDATVNAKADQAGKTWKVFMYGGLARRPEVTKDGFSMVICHEFGHHLGGFPFASSWAANDGQSDYFATKICPNLLWTDDEEGNAAARDTVAAIPKEKCDEVYSTEAAQNLCYRTLNASKGLADLLASLGRTKANWETPDTKVVTSTDNDHPAAQCRLDTYLAGALCTQSTDLSVIHGKNLGSNRNSLQAEEDSSASYCTARDGYTLGKRPACWFKARL